MSRVSIQAAVTMAQLQNKLDLIGHNMANASTTGYKTRQADFSSLLVQQINNHDDPKNPDLRYTPDGIRIGSGAALGHTNMDLRLGAVQETGRELDIALLENNHLFQILVTENGVTENQYTRAGNLYLNPINDGQVMLTTADGHPVVGEDGPLIFDDGFEGISITTNGTIDITRNGATEAEGRIATVEATRPRLLEAAGANNFRFSEETLAAFNQEELVQLVNAEQTKLKSGALEGSNVDLAKQMTEMITAQRAYQFNARSISMSDQMAGLVNQLR